jgi:hypothetical protein
MISCQKEAQEAPTAAPAATAVPVLPTEIPAEPTIIATPTPGYLEPRYKPSDRPIQEPEISKINASKGSVSAQNPSFIDLEITTLHPLSLTLIVSKIEEDGRLFVIDSNPVTGLDSQMPNSSVIEPGIHEELLSWDALGMYLTDGLNGVFVNLQADDLNSGRIRGMLKEAGSDTSRQVNLQFDSDSGFLTGVSDAQSGEPVEYFPGDVFLSESNYLEGGDSFMSEAGTELSFTENGLLYLARRTLPDGRYQLDYKFENPNMKPLHLYEQEVVDSIEYESGGSVFFDPGSGLQFALPPGWAVPENQFGTLTTNSFDDTYTLTVAYLPVEISMTSGRLRQEALDAYGDISILYEEPMTIGDVNTSWTAYGYESEDVLMTGVFMTMVSGGWGYVFDLEGTDVEDEALVNMADQIFDTIAIRSVNREEHPGQWRDADLGAYTVSADRSLLQFTTSTGWERFTSKDGDSFISFRQLDSTLADRSDLRTIVLTDLLRPQAKIALSEQYAVGFGNEQWNRIDYRVIDFGEEPRIGFLMRSAAPTTDVLVWAESTEDKIAAMERETFMPMTADVELKAVP